MNNRTSSLRASLLTLCLASAFFAATGVASAADTTIAEDYVEPVDDPSAARRGGTCVTFVCVEIRPIYCYFDENNGFYCRW